MKITVDLGKVQYITKLWENNHGLRFDNKPTHPTVNGSGVPDDWAPEVNGWPRETMLDRAKRRNLLDTWRMVIYVQFASNHSVKFAGKRALSIWKEWNRRQFSKNKKGNNMIKTFKITIKRSEYTCEDTDVVLTCHGCPHLGKDESGHLCGLTGYEILSYYDEDEQHPEPLQECDDLIYNELTKT